MKTKTFLLLILFLGIGWTQLNAQKWNNGTTVTTQSGVWNGYEVPVYCDGTMVDDLTGTVNYLNYIFWKDGNWVREIHYIWGEVQSTKPPLFEVFKVFEIDHCIAATGIDKFKVYLIGNKGSNYAGTFLYYFNTGKLELVKMICKKCDN